MHMMSKKDTLLKRTHTQKRLSLIRILFEEVSFRKGFEGNKSQLLSTHSLLKYRLCSLFESVMAML